MARLQDLLKQDPNGYISMAELDALERAQSGGPSIGQIPGSFGPGQGSFQRSGGNLINLTPHGWQDAQTQEMVSPASGRPNQELSLDYASPLDVMGAKGYRIKGDPNRALLNDGRIVTLNAGDVGAQQAARQKQEAAQLDMDIKRAELDYKKAQTSKLSPGGKPEGLNLTKDQQWNPVTQRAEAIPGSKLDVQQRGAFATDRGAYTGISDAAAATRAKVERILGDKEGFAGNFGGWNAYASQFFPESANTRKSIESLKADLKRAGLEAMRAGGGIGAMSQAEWPIVEAQIAAIDPSLSEDEARYQLQSIVARMATMEQRAKEKFETEWSDRLNQSPAVQDRGSMIDVGGQSMLVVGRTPDGSIKIRDPKTGRTGTVRQ